MPKRGEQMSDELRAKLAEGRAKAKARKEATKAETTKTNTPKPTEEPKQPVDTTPTVDPGLAQLTEMVLELKKQNEEKDKILNAFMSGVQSQGNNVATGNNKGRLVGTTEKYSVDKKVYEDPRPRLFAEPRLKRIAFDQNYELDYDVAVTSYQTVDGVQMKEPKFTIKLNQIVLDDQGEATSKRVGRVQMIFFEDPETAIVVANQNGLPIDDENEAQFLNDMRYIRIRDWLFDFFWKPATSDAQSNKRSEVIGGQVVETWEVSTEGNAKINFGELNSKLRG